jgi:hypothetical protein
VTDGLGKDRYRADLEGGDDVMTVTDGLGKDNYELSGGANATLDPGDYLTVVDAVADGDVNMVTDFETRTDVFQ